MVRPANHDAYARLPDWYPQIRRYAPAFLENIEFAFPKAQALYRDLLRAPVEDSGDDALAVLRRQG